MPLDEIVKREPHAHRLSLVVGGIHGGDDAAMRAQNEAAVLDGEEARAATHAMDGGVPSVQNCLPCLLTAPEPRLHTRRDLDQHASGRHTWLRLNYSLLIVLPACLCWVIRVLGREEAPMPVLR
jgi:hypothetical protein